MEARKVISLHKKYIPCPRCGNEYLGSTEGGITITENEMHRYCKCGLDVITDEDGNIIKNRERKIK